MHFDPGNIYRIHNRGNNWQKIFFRDNNYYYFLKKVNREWKKYCEILAYCLTPNEFEFIVVPNHTACYNLMLNNKLTDLQNLSKAIGKALSSYTRAINRQNHTTGNLFQRKTKSECLGAIEGDEKISTTRHHLTKYFHEIHKRPVDAKLVKRRESWKFSSYQDYYAGRENSYCNRSLALDLLRFSENHFNEM